MQDDVKRASGRAGRWSGGSRRRRRSLVVVSLVVADAISVLLAGIIATWIRFGRLGARVGFENTSLTVAFWELAFVVVPLWVALLALANLYDVDAVTWGLSVAGRIARALSMGVVGLILITYVAKTPGLSRAWTLLFWVLSILFVLGTRSGIALFVAWARSTGRLLQPTLIVGSNAEADDIIRVLRGDPSGGLVPIAVLASSQAERLALTHCSDDVPVVGSARELAAAVVEHRIDSVVIASSAFDHDVVARMIAELRTADCDLHISSGLFEVLTSRVIVSEIAGVPLITVKGISLSAGKVWAKRVFDLAVAGLVVIVGVPVWAIIAASIKLTSPGPVLYSQERVGKGGERFGMYKFRSMYVDADARRAELAGRNEATGPMFKMKDDPRITSAGKWLRRFSIDEFPQIINVLKGEMSLVGPRPPLPVEVARYTTHDMRRLEVVPGMTGLWQVSGRSSLTFDEMVRLDLFYIENWSVGLDITLIFRTVPAVLFAHGAY
jgi:exopolysaccharide biosynthesis polyprenyl glycosylphosphotransferase